MPRLSKYLGLVLLLASPGALMAQMPSATGATGQRPATPLPGGAALVEAAASKTAATAIPPSPARQNVSAPLSSRGRSNRWEWAKPGSSPPSLPTMAGSLAAVLGLFLALAWVLRRLAPKSSAVLPGEVVEVLGRAPLAGRQQMHLLRCGNKLLLVSVTPAGAETLTEVTDPAEVDRLLGLCRRAPLSGAPAFRQVLQQFGPYQENRNA